jgi:predicted alpha/beta-fold hydrolase
MAVQERNMNHSPVFRPAPWLPGPHLQTLWASLIRKWPAVETTRERVELPDGDFIDLDWARSEADGPIVIVIHGLEGSLRTRYAAGIMRTLAAQGLRPVLMNLRGCSGEPNRLARRYHSGETGDLAHIVGLLQQRHPGRPMAAIGYSLGGNMLLKWLGETGSANPLIAAVAVSVPFDLQLSSQRLGEGFSRLYAWALLRSLKRSIAEKIGRFPLPLTKQQLRTIANFWQFDDQITAPLHGFTNARDYYEQSSSRRFLGDIQVPTLVVHSKDDPFLYPDALPDRAELSPQVQLELLRGGGHVGFVSGPPWAPHYWLEERIPVWLQGRLQA